MIESVGIGGPPGTTVKVPIGACDCHAHVFGPYAHFPLAQERGYTPPEAPISGYLAMQNEVGLTHGVIVHPSAYGLDHAALRAALRDGGGRLRGVAVVDSQVTDDTLIGLHDAGVRAARFTETSGTAGRRFAGSVGLAHLPALVSRLRSLGWHVEIWAPLAHVVEELPRLLRCDLPIVIDHMGSLDVTRGVDEPCFREFLQGLESGRLWVKLCVQRSSMRFPGYEDVRPFFDALVAARQDRMLWGSDWPFLNMGERTPTVLQLLSVFMSWTANSATQRQILVDNPATRYGFVEATAAA